MTEKVKRTRRKAKNEEIKSDPQNPKFYFTNETQDAIVEFQKSLDRKVREKLYVGKILPAFEKLVENLINIHKFSGLHDTYEDLKNDCVNFLFETIHKFNPDMGTNAFSYFNVVAKNWLIIKTKQKVQRGRRDVSIDDPKGLSNSEIQIVEEKRTVPSQDFFLENAENVAGILKMMYEIRSRVKVENELLCINSVITIFENINDIDILNKSAILLYIRELSGLSPKQLTTSMQAVKKHYNKLKVEQNSSY
ncbi:MAG: hypothetical protein EBU90_20065 [Proteobacteria bacterium]|nr:hypothetical protein [Pseudomonadota bacterium]